VRRIVTALVAFAGVSVLAGPVAGHPLGNFSISHYAAIQVNEHEVELRYVLDLAEIPTFQELQDQGVVADAAHPSALAYAARKADALRAGLRLELGRAALPLERHGVEIIFPPGAGGLPTLKIGARYRATLPPAPGPTSLSYRDENYADRAGWKEIIVTAGPGVTLVASSAPEKDRSQALADYPTDLLGSPPQDLAAYATFTRDRPVGAAAPTRAPRPGSPAVQPSPPPLRAQAAQDPARSEPSRREPPERGVQEAVLQPNRQATRDTGLALLLLATPASLGVILAALGVAAGLGAFHALEPGHGKTMVAAYLVGSRGTAWHAVVLGLVVTASHTAAVYALGAASLFASRYVVPERIYPWLAVATGATIAGLGLYLFARRCAGGHAHGHDHHHHGHHHHGHGDDDHAHAHGHAHGERHADAHDHHAHGHEGSGRHHGGEVSLQQLFTLGVTGGIVPCPAALVVLLGAVSVGRVGFGLLLIVAFSVGLAAVLIVTGLLVVYARHLMLRVRGEGRLIARWLPLTSAAAITLIGAAMTIRALQAVLTGGAASG
jgi:ABC-type nickel/cobalt efflux system permease component RcnA